MEWLQKGDRFYFWYLESEAVKYWEEVPVALIGGEEVEFTQATYDDMNPHSRVHPIYRRGRIYRYLGEGEVLRVGKLKDWRI